MILTSLRALPALALTTAAKTLRLMAAVNAAVADRLAPEEPQVAGPARRQAQGADAPTPARNAAAATAAPAHTATAETAVRDDRAAAARDDEDIATLASRTAPEVIAAIDGLSTTQLGELYDHESRHRRRRTVLEALATASAQPPHADEPADLPELDVRVADELVYSTATPPR